MGQNINIILLFLCISIFATAMGNVNSVVTYETEHGFIIVNAKINGVPGRFLLDTGSGGCNLSTNFSTSLNLEIVDSVNIVDAFGTFDKIPIALIEKISFSGIQVDSIAIGLSKDLDLFFECLKVDGILGNILFQNTILQIDSKNKELRFLKEIPVTYLEKYFVSEVTFSGGMPFIKLEVSNDTIGIQTVFDTGHMCFYVLSISDYNRLKADNAFNEYFTSFGSSGAGAFGAEKNETSHLLKMPLLKINSVSFLNATVRTSNGSSCIGTELLKYGITTVDYINNKFFFEPYDSINNIFDMGNVLPSISLTYKDSHLRVGFIWDKKLEEKIKIGDKIISVWGRNIEDIHFCEAIGISERWFKLWRRVFIKVERDNGKKARLFVKV